MATPGQGPLSRFGDTASNAGMIHAFDMEGLVSNLPYGGSEFWYYIPRAKLDKNPDAGSKEFDGFQADDLMRSGQTYVNDGRLSLDHVWLSTQLVPCLHRAAAPEAIDRICGDRGLRPRRCGVLPAKLCDGPLPPN